MWHNSWTGGNWIFMASAMLVFWSLVVAGALTMAAAVRRPTGTAQSRGVPSSRDESGAEAGAVLDERLARDEVAPEAYLARREMLSH